MKENKNKEVDKKKRWENSRQLTTADIITKYKVRNKTSLKKSHSKEPDNNINWAQEAKTYKTEPLIDN